VQRRLGEGVLGHVLGLVQVTEQGEDLPDDAPVGRRFIIATASETTTDLRTLSCGPEGSNLPELESAISLTRQFGSYASTHLKSFPN
jgi:hypothetical protein